MVGRSAVQSYWFSRGPRGEVGDTAALHKRLVLYVLHVPELISESELSTSVFQASNLVPFVRHLVGKSQRFNVLCCVLEGTVSS
jgi:hypothetical protein